MSSTLLVDVSRVEISATAFFATEAAAAIAVSYRGMYHVFFGSCSR